MVRANQAALLRYLKLFLICIIFFNLLVLCPWQQCQILIHTVVPWSRFREMTTKTRVRIETVCGNGFVK